MKHWVLAMVCWAMMGCMATGVKVQQEQLTQFVPGTTTIRDVETALGKPTAKTRRDNGTWQLQYSYIQTQLNAASFIPIANLIAGGGSTEATTVTLEFDIQEHLLSYAATQGGANTGTGLSTGKRQ